VRTEMTNSEIVLNLWYVTDETGAIDSLRVHPYVEVGSDEEKLTCFSPRTRRT
jgi:hypothetical protein